MLDKIKVPLLKNCARCGKDHPELEFNKFTRSLQSASEFGYWTLCPNNGEPILLKIVQDVSDSEDGE